MDNLWITIISSICSGVVGALIGGAITLFVERRKLKHEVATERKKELKDEYEKRPRLEIKEYKSIEKSNIESQTDFECILLNFDNPVDENGHLIFKYDKKAVIKDNLCCVEYVLENTGKTEIDSVCILSTQPRTTSITELKNRQFLIDGQYLSYEAWSDKRFIKPGETISIKVCYLKDKAIASPISAIAAIYLQDINGNLWHQALFCPTKEIENSIRTNFADFKNRRDVALAIECFKKPYLW